MIEYADMKKCLITGISALALIISCATMNGESENASRSVSKLVIVENSCWTSDTAKSAYASGKGIQLSGNECMTVYFNQSDKTKESQFAGNKVYKAGVAEPDGNGRYGFTHSPISGVEEYNYFFLLPHHITTSSTIQARLFPLQFPGDDTFDPNYDYLIGKPVFGSPVKETAVVDGFKRITAPVKVVLNDKSGALNAEDLMSVTVSFDGFTGRITGYFSPDLGDAFEDAKIIYWSETTAGNALTALFPSGQKCISGTYNIWFSTLPATLPAGQKVTVNATSRTRNVSFEASIKTSCEISSDKINLLQFDLDTPLSKSHSIIQDFSTATSPDNLPAASDGKRYPWTFSEVSAYKTNGKYGMHGGVVLKTNSSVLSIPAIDGKVIKSLRVYSHEETYSSSSVTCNINLKSNGALIASKSMNPYGGDVRNGGFVEFRNLFDKQSLTLDVTASDGSKTHIVPISAISMEIVDAGTYVDDVECYDYPTDYYTSTKYAASVNGQEAHVFQTVEPHVLAFGCKEGMSAAVEISVPEGVSSVSVRPKAKNYEYSISDGKLILNLKAYDRAVVEINGDTASPLFVFANPVDEFKPTSSSSNLIYLAPGTIRTEDIILTSGQTLYIDGGAVLKGRVYAKRQNNIKVLGPGVIDGLEDSPESNRPVYFEYTDDITFNDCIVLNRTSWTVNMFECNDILMDNCKIIATKNPAVTNGHQNDGFSIIGSDRMRVTRGFSYSHDDCYSIKTSKWVYKGVVTDVVYDDIICWNNTYGHGIELGTGINENLGGVVWRNCYILHSGGSARPDVIAAVGICHAAGGTVSDILYENIWIEDCRTRPAYIRIYKAADTENVGTGVVWSPGKINNVVLKNVNMDAASPVKGVIQGYDEDHKVIMTIENMTIGGVRLTKDNFSNYFEINSNTDITIK